MALRLEHDHPREAMPKAWILRGYKADRACRHRRLTVGFRNGRGGRSVFARDGLLQRLRERQRPVIPFEDFFDIIRALQNMQENTVG